MQSVIPKVADALQKVPSDAPPNFKLQSSCKRAEIWLYFFFLKRTYFEEMKIRITLVLSQNQTVSNSCKTR